MALHEKYAGKTAEEKLKELRAKMKKEHTDMYVLTSLDDIAWLLNIRGNDIAYNPVVLSYVIVTEDKLYLFVNEKCFTEKHIHIWIIIMIWILLDI